MSDRPRILLIAFQYPPYSAVGAFRWAKLSKYLARAGHPIDVLSVDWSAGGPNANLEDVEHPNITIHRLRSGYPHQLRMKRYRSHLLSVLHSRALTYYNRLTGAQDPAQRWGRWLLPAAKQLVAAKGIPVVIATGAPFQVNRWAAKLRTELDSVCLIQDFRDAWAHTPVKRREADQQTAVQQMQYSVENADVIVSVTEELLDRFRVSDRPRIYRCIGNGFDPEFVPTSSTRPEPTTDFAYAGSLNMGRLEPAFAFLRGVRELVAEGRQLKVELVGGQPMSLKREFADLVAAGALSLRGTVAQAEAHAIVQAARCALLFTAREVTYAASTKLFEYAMLEVPTVEFGYGGTPERLIQDRGLGLAVDLSKQSAREGILAATSLDLASLRFDVADRAYDVIAEKYSDLIAEAMDRRADG